MCFGSPGTPDRTEEETATTNGSTAFSEDLPEPCTPECPRRQAPDGCMARLRPEDFGWEHSVAVTPAAPRRQNQRPAAFADAIDGARRDFGWQDDDKCEDGPASPFRRASQNALFVSSSSPKDGSKHDKPYVSWFHRVFMFARSSCSSRRFRPLSSDQTATASETYPSLVAKAPQIGSRARV